MTGAEAEAAEVGADAEAGALELDGTSSADELAREEASVVGATDAELGAGAGALAAEARGATALAGAKRLDCEAPQSAATTAAPPTPHSQPRRSGAGRAEAASAPTVVTSGARSARGGSGRGTSMVGVI